MKKDSSKTNTKKANGNPNKNKKSKAQKYNQDSWDRLTHKGWTDFQYGISKKQKEDKSIFSMPRFGEQGASTAGKPKKGESAKMKAKRKSFKARHRKNIAKGKTHEN